jgi:3-hydroxyacyl-CoA dehydrogenase/enoyl-CoA hydratase/3-hydroxybutyryl-CoA epimerase/enoyl-CoA isomerase
MALFSGNCIELKALPEIDGAFELSVNLKGASVNTFNAETLKELREALAVLPKSPKALLVSSGKDTFLAGADITEFLEHFKKPESELTAWIGETQKLFNQIEDLDAPTVCIIAGFALGGGLEFALTCDYRIAAAGSRIGLPETKLGIIPGWGGTVRLPRLIGLDPAIEWITSGNQNDAQEAFKLGVVDALVAPADLRAAGIDLLSRLSRGELDWKKRKEQKKSRLPLNGTEKTMGFSIMKAGVFAAAGPNYPAPFAAIEAIEKSQDLTRDGALENEAGQFARVSKTSQARALVGTFLADQAVKKKARGAKSLAKPVKKTAVLGAGIMGGGIAYQSAYSKVPILMKDLREEALARGMKEAATLLDKQIQRGKMSALQMAEILGRIQPTLDQAALRAADFAIEAVTENEKVKIAVLKELEDTVAPDTVITSNTSTISITALALNLKRPELFCGMHFFNPVPKMPLVEIIRGAKTAPETIATAVQYASLMGKTPIVVNDCPGFLVNRVLFAYFTAFNQLVKSGVDFVRIDKVMEKWGWPMGPAYLLDVVGVDTANHASEVMAKGFPDRMPLDAGDSVALLFKAGRYGQKNGKGFYTYTLDAKGKPKKEVQPQIYELLGQDPKSLSTAATGTAGAGNAITDQEIIDRLMLPFIFESTRCLAEKIVEEAHELDLAMLTGLGFPPFRGGPIRYAESIGATALIEKGKELAPKHGALYKVTDAIEKTLKETLNHV